MDDTGDGKVIFGGAGRVCRPIKSLLSVLIRPVNSTSAAALKKLSFCAKIAKKTSTKTGLPADNTGSRLHKKFSYCGKKFF
jgi:hypothetical protein